jgi:hypothetical protein
LHGHWRLGQANSFFDGAIIHQFFEQFLQWIDGSVRLIVVIGKLVRHVVEQFF